MQNKKPHNVSEQVLDNLLKRAFLNLDNTNPKNKDIMETVSNQYLNPLPITFSIKNFIFNKLIIGITCLAIAIGLGIYFYPKNNNITTNKNKIINPKTNIIFPNVINEPEKTDVIEAVNPPIVPLKNEINSLGQTNNNTNSIYLINDNPVIESDNEPTSNAINAIVANEDTGYVFPVLTEKEIKDNHKQKRKMVETLAKFSKEKYARTPMGTFNYNGQNVSLNSFYIQNAEVTNLEYLTFIFDLLIQNRKEEFIKAKPDQSQWIKAFANATYDFSNLKETYFSNKMYRDYPVVNISKEGAEMYCKWLTVATNEYLASKDKPLMNDLRIPTNHEWTYAARSGTVTTDFPWRTDVVQNKFGCFLANFCIKNFGEIKRDPKAKCGYGFPNAITTAGTILGSLQTTVMVYAYNPNDLGLYCMSGNAAEMVYEENLKTKERTHGTRGGSWYSDVDYLKLTSENEFKNVTKASPMIGFRPVVTAPLIK
jgi:formylglycine-generating enzyme required for sulfatase activity